MATLTFEQLNARVAAHWQAEAARNAPKPAAIRAVYRLASLLGDLDDRDYFEVMELLRSELALRVCDFAD